MRSYWKRIKNFCEQNECFLSTVAAMNSALKNPRQIQLSSSIRQVGYLSGCHQCMLLLDGRQKDRGWTCHKVLGTHTQQNSPCFSSVQHQKIATLWKKKKRHIPVLIWFWCLQDTAFPTLSGTSCGVWRPGSQWQWPIAGALEGFHILWGSSGDPKEVRSELHKVKSNTHLPLERPGSVHLKWQAEV